MNLNRKRKASISSKSLYFKSTVFEEKNVLYFICKVLMTSFLLIFVHYIKKRAITYFKYILNKIKKKLQFLFGCINYNECSENV